MSTADQLEERHAGFSSWQDYEDFLLLLQRLAESGAIKEVTPNPGKARYIERWFVENASGRVFQLVEPDPPAHGLWSEIHLQEHAV